MEMEMEMMLTGLMTGIGIGISILICVVSGILILLYMFDELKIHKHPIVFIFSDISLSIALFVLIPCGAVGCLAFLNICVAGYTAYEASDSTEEIIVAGLATASIIILLAMGIMNAAGLNIYSLMPAENTECQISEEATTTSESPLVEVNINTSEIPEVSQTEGGLVTDIQIAEPDIQVVETPEPVATVVKTEVAEIKNFKAAIHMDGDVLKKTYNLYFRLPYSDWTYLETDSSKVEVFNTLTNEEPAYMEIGLDSLNRPLIYRIYIQEETN